MSELDPDLDHAQRERRLRLFAIPLALLAARWLTSGEMGRMLSRVLLSMWVHELGHAVTAWMCGFPAFPGPWLTPVAESRSVAFSLAVGVGLGLLCFQLWRRGRRGWAAGAAAGLALHLFWGFALPAWKAQAYILFGGDGGCFVLGTALLATFYVGPESSVRRNGLRWGFLVIGAVAFMDAARTWWGAVHDVELIPFGANEGAGASDPSRLVDDYGWTVQGLIHGYVTLSAGCLGVLGLLYVFHLLRPGEVGEPHNPWSNPGPRS